MTWGQGREMFKMYVFWKSYTIYNFDKFNFIFIGKFLFPLMLLL